MCVGAATDTARDFIDFSTVGKKLFNLLIELFLQLARCFIGLNHNESWAFNGPLRIAAGRAKGQTGVLIGRYVISQGVMRLGKLLGWNSLRFAPSCRYELSESKNH